MDEAQAVVRLRAAGCVFAEDEAAILIDGALDDADLERMVAQRVQGLPLEQVVGWAQFCGLRVLVDPGVFVPRRRTEFLVEEAVALAGPEPVVLDLCCGTGAIGLAIASRLAGATLHSADLDPVAVACARRNIAPSVGSVYEGDLFDPIPMSLQGQIDLIVACVPYVPTQEINLLPSEAREYENHLALDGGSDGLDVARALIRDAPKWLAVGGHVALEVSERQVDLIDGSIEDAGLQCRVSVSSEWAATVVIASR